MNNIQVIFTQKNPITWSYNMSKCVCVCVWVLSFSVDSWQFSNELWLVLIGNNHQSVCECVKNNRKFSIEINLDQLDAIPLKWWYDDDFTWPLIIMMMIPFHVLIYCLFSFFVCLFQTWWWILGGIFLVFFIWIFFRKKNI